MTYPIRAGTRYFGAQGKKGPFGNKKYFFIACVCKVL